MEVTITTIPNTPPALVYPVLPEDDPLFAIFQAESAKEIREVRTSSTLEAILNFIFDLEDYDEDEE